MDFLRNCPRKAYFMTELCTVLLNVCLFSWCALVTETMKGAPPVLPVEVKTTHFVREGTKSFRLDCPAEGDPPPMVLWSKDGETIGVGWTRFRLINNDRDLKIKNVELDDQGVYVCKAVNGFGSIDVRYELTVIGKDEPLPDSGDYSDEHEPHIVDNNGQTKAPYWLDSKSKDLLTQAPLMKRIGSSIKLKCPVGGNPRPDVIWLKDGRIIDEGSKGWTLHLKDLKETDGGKYTCKVVNVFGAINATYEILLFDGDTSPPEFDKTHPFNTTVAEGQTATLQCKVKSSIPPLIQWLKKIGPEDEVKNENSTLTVHGQRYLMLDSFMTHKTTKKPNNTFVNQLVIPSVTLEYSGWYVCVVIQPVLQPAHPAGHMLYRSAYLKVVHAYQRIPISDKIPLHILIGIPVAVLLLLAVGYAAWFLQRYQKKSSELTKAPVLRPPPPNYPPPLLPSSKHMYRKEHYKHYQHLDPQATVPLHNGDFTDRDIYEATPQPYELHYDPQDLSDSYTELSGPHRIQHYPSMYSCS